MNRQVSIPAKCQKHPGYKVKRAPTGNCKRCWELWDEKELEALINWSQNLPASPAPHIPEHEEYGKLIEKWIGRKKV